MPGRLSVSGELGAAEHLPYDAAAGKRKGLDWAITAYQEAGTRALDRAIVDGAPVVIEYSMPIINFAKGVMGAIREVTAADAQGGRRPCFRVPSFKSLFELSGDTAQRIEAKLPLDVASAPLDYLSLPVGFDCVGSDDS